MDFTRDNDADPSGTSLLTEIRATGPAIKALFGTFPGLRQSRAKYSDSITIRHAPTGELFTLYMSFGQWRIGGRHHACTALGKLAATVSPDHHAAWAEMDGATILANRRSAMDAWRASDYSSAGLRWPA